MLTTVGFTAKDQSVAGQTDKKVDPSKIEPAKLEPPPQ
jgi:hypothetical protein